ncbi:hypothetical protein H9L39_16751 [Fusarium oxysporum f. sp. albedinis]|nr:hypothetical protein H9L39_16751 [Fusarium oxysporum f. sp. albedinis]
MPVDSVVLHIWRASHAVSHASRPIITDREIDFLAVPKLNQVKSHNGRIVGPISTISPQRPRRSKPVEVTLSLGVGDD